MVVSLLVQVDHALFSVCTNHVKFEWDPAKAESTARKHHVNLMLAITVFDDPWALIAPDPKHSAAERVFAACRNFWNRDEL